MKIFRCSQTDIDYAFEAVYFVKYEDEEVRPSVNKKDIELFLKNTDNHFYVAIINDKAAGFLIAYELQRIDRNSKMMFFYEIGVLKEFRCNGVGTTLINLLKNYCIENGFMKMFVPTNRSNIPAMGLYEKTGGQESDHCDEVFFTWHF